MVWYLAGPGPIRRTLKYLDAGKLIFKDRVKIMAVHYNMHRWSHGKDKPYEKIDSHQGLREFYFWHVPHIQYKNPNVQIVRFTDFTPSPFIRCWLEDGKDVIFDCDAQDKDAILDRLIKVLGKSKERLEMEYKLNVTLQSADNPALFGWERDRFCICEVPGHVPCPGVCEIPVPLKGKYYQYKQEELEKYEQDMVENPPKPIPWERRSQSEFFKNWNFMFSKKRRYIWK